MIGIRTGKGRSCSRARGKRNMGLLRQRKKCSLVGGWSKGESAKRSRRGTQGPSHDWPLKITLNFLLLYPRNNRKTFKRRGNMIGYVFLKALSGCSVNMDWKKEKRKLPPSSKREKITIWTRMEIMTWTKTMIYRAFKDIWCSSGCRNEGNKRDKDNFVIFLLSIKYLVSSPQDNINVFEWINNRFS